MRPVHLLLGLAVLALASGAFWLLSSDSGGASERTELAGPVVVEPQVVDPRAPAEKAAPPSAGEVARAGVSTPQELDDADAALPVQVQEDEFFVRGRVVDERGQGIAEAKVYGARNERRMEFALDSQRFRERYRRRLSVALTDSEGRFELAAPRAGLLRLAVRADGFAPFDRDDYELPPREHVDVGEIALTAGWTLAGRVVDGSGRGVAKASLSKIPTDRDFGGSLREMATWVADADSDGRFEVNQLTPGPWKLLVRSEQHPDHLHEGVLERRRVEGVELQLGEGHALRGVVRGRIDEPLAVRATPTGAPTSVASAARPDTRTATVDAEGGFELEGLSEMFAYELAAYAQSDDVVRPVWLTAPVVARVGEGSVELVLRDSATLAFTIIDGSNGERVDEYNLWIGSTLGERTWRSRLEAGEDFELDPATGRVVLEGIQSTGKGGITGIEVRTGGYYFERRDGLHMAPGANLDLGAIALTPLPHAAVRVTDGSTGMPLPGAVVHVANLHPVAAPKLAVTDGEGPQTRGPGRTTTTCDENGEATAPGPNGTQLYLWATHPDFAPSEPRGVVLGGQAPQIALELSRGATIVALVRDDLKRPLAGRTLQRNEWREELEDGSWQGAGGRTDAITDSEGRAVFDLLRPGLHRFSVVPPRRGRSVREWQEVRVAEGEVREIELDAPALFTLSGRVAEAGFPLAGARVWLHPGHKRSWRLTLLGPRANDPSTRTDSEGRYEIRDVPVGEHLLVVDHPTRAMDAEAALGFDKPGTYAYDFELPITRISGRVLDTERNPLSGIEVSVLREEDARRLRDSMLGSGERATNSSSLERTGTTDANGRFEARGVLAEQPLVVVARGANIRTQRSEHFTVQIDGVRDGIELVAKPAGTLRVTVTNADGTFAPNVNVHASYRGKRRKDAEAQHLLTNGQGSVLMDGLTPGPWRVRIDPPERSEDADPLPAQEVDVKARKRSNVAFQLR